MYTAFIIDVFARAIEGWKVSNRMNIDIMIHYSDRGVHCLPISYTDKMTDSGVITSVDTMGDSYDNALSKTVNGLYKSEVIEYLKERWTGINDVELAILE